MKKTKMIVSLMLTLVMVLAMAIPAFAVETPAETTTPSITIQNLVKGQTYKIYKMFDLESYDKEAGAYSYKPVEAWKNFVTGSGAGTAYFEVNSDGYVNLKAGADVKEIAKAALEYAQKTENGVTAVATYDVDATSTETSHTFDLATAGLGYYLVDSSVGTVCGLTTTNPTATVKEKNSTPTVEKKIVLADKSLVDSNTATMGDTVNYQTTITVKTGAENYALHDKMDAGLTLVSSTIKVSVDGTDVPASVTGGATTTTNYTVTPDADNHGFKIQFDNNYIKELAKDLKQATDTEAETTKTIVVTYSAVLNRNAVVAVPEDNKGNVNETWVTYGDKNTETTHSKTTTYTYQFDLVKTDADGKKLTGAEFDLYNVATGGTPIKVVKVSEGVYRVATTEDNVTTSAKIEAGTATIKGLGNGTYYVQETKQPVGYNLLKERKAVTISDASLIAKYNADETYKEGALQVVNNKGTELPSTGGVGTTIFYIVGGILLVGAGVVLVVRRRINAESK